MKASDYHSRESRGNVIVLQPKILSKYDSKSDELHHLAQNQEILESMLHDVMSLQFVHAGFLEIELSEGFMRPTSHDTCGGILEFKDPHPEKGGEFLSSPQQIITCSNPECKIIFETSYSFEEIQRLLLQLFLKQMVPELRVCNYLDCNQTRPGTSLSQQEAKRIQELGVVPVLDGFFNGLYDSDCELRFGQDLALGLTLMPILTSLANFSGLDKWVRLLIVELWKQEKEALAIWQRFSLGPKPAR